MHRDDITPSVVRRLLEEQTPEWADLPIAPVEREGWDNRTYRLGDELSVRLPSDDMYTAQVAKEHRWLPVLAASLPLPVPCPVFRGAPSSVFPRPWSIYRWLPGRPVTAGLSDPVPDLDLDLVVLAQDVAGFLTALQAVPVDDGPVAGSHSHGRGGPVEIWDDQTRAAIARFGPASALDVWEAAVGSAAAFAGPPVWVHGDVSGSNLLEVDGTLSAVIDFGCSAVGDPACDLVMAWTTFTGVSRDAFVAGLDVDPGTWARARGWALWKAIITLARTDGDAEECAAWARRWGWRIDPAAVVAEIVSDVSREGDDSVMDRA